MRLQAQRSRAIALRFSALLLLSTGLASPGFAQDGESYTITGDDGYGIAECMKTGNECGRVIADSWCESHGHAHALGFGMGGDVTGSVAAPDSPVMKVAAGDVVIRCGD